MYIRLFRHMLEYNAAAQDREMGIAPKRFSLWRKPGNAENVAQPMNNASEQGISGSELSEFFGKLEADVAQIVGELPVARVITAEELVGNLRTTVGEAIAQLPVVEDPRDTSRS